ncbi:MAG: RibD family protein [Methanospirillum sp.]|nr:RibD family protein [Methanospirillum sp.]
MICYLSVSLDGRLDGFEVDLEHYYRIAARFKEDATLVGSETSVVAIEKYGGVENTYDEGPAPARAAPGDERPLLVVVDGRGRVRRWSVSQEAPYWRGWIALLADSVPGAHRTYLASRNVDPLIVGTDRVDLALALGRLHREYGVRRIRVDSGGRLNGALLRAGLVDEVHLLVCPWLAGGSSPRSSFVADDLAPGAPGTPLERVAVEPFDDGTVLLSYRAVR